MKADFSKFNSKNIKRFQMCSRIKLLRKIALEMPYTINEKDKMRVIKEFPDEE